MAKFKITDNKITINARLRGKQTINQYKLVRGSGDKLKATYKRRLTKGAKKYAKDNAGFPFQDVVKPLKGVGLINNAPVEKRFSKVTSK